MSTSMSTSTGARRQVAIVTGGTGAIGSAIAARLQADGKLVVAADRDLRAVPEGQIFRACELTDPAGVIALFEFARGLGDIACLVAAHGILMETQAGAADPAAISTVIDINLKSVAYLCNAAKTYLSPPAAIVLISSWTAMSGRLRGSFAYQATKAAVESLTHTFAVAYGPEGIRVNCIAPGFMAAPMKGEGSELRNRQGGMDGVIQGAPLRCLVEGEDIAAATAYLISHGAAAVTGIVLPVDAGYRAL